MRFTPALFKHAEVLLSELLRSPFPADLVVSRYFRQHRELGHADRGFVAESVYSVLRRKRSLSARCLDAVSYTHLDVYKRQVYMQWFCSGPILTCLTSPNRRH